MKIIFVFLLGASILVGAIVLNMTASLLGLMSWYEFLNDAGKARGWSLLWLFFLYPLGLGGIAYAAVRLFNI
jgi:hypothetical protein